MKSKSIGMTLVFLIFCARIFAQENQLWNGISSYFDVPAAFKGDFGRLTSVLKFKDGSLVANANDWQKRRLEIRKDWVSYLGEWPSIWKDQKFEVLATEDKGTYTKSTVRFYWTPNEQTIGYLLSPHKKGKLPAVVTVFYEPETSIGEGKPRRDFALQLVQRGFVTLSIGTKEASARQEFSLYYPSIDKVSVQPLSMLAYAANNAFFALANQANVDRDRIGIVGHSFGGKWAMFASCLTDNFAAAAWSDPGIAFQEDRESVNYWEPWYLGFHPKPWRSRGLITPDNPAFGPYLDMRSKGRDLHELQVLMAPRPFLVSGGSEDPVARWRVLNHSIQVNELLGQHNRVAMSNRPTHEPTDESNELIYNFFSFFLQQK
ncbi:sialidase [Sphingobacterium sp. SYP-B4668]|uniref:sialidase n=1 Tax=Sphingobacterium sp. SYP-B4668 TaxID=2996035 RepID=UPI0022DDF09E|nr:sialidase [Sphingobacterium sp. SYP-B4668]